MKSGTRDLLIGIASIVFSVCAGIWTLFNYNVNQNKIELEAIFSITGKIEFIKLKKASDIGLDKVENEEQLLQELLSEARYRFHQIKRPLLVGNTQWDNKWTSFYEHIDSAYSDGFKNYEDKIYNTWTEILEMKTVRSLDTMLKQKKAEAKLKNGEEEKNEASYYNHNYIPKYFVVFEYIK